MSLSVNNDANHHVHLGSMLNMCLISYLTMLNQCSVSVYLRSVRVGHGMADIEYVKE